MQECFGRDECAEFPSFPLNVFFFLIVTSFFETSIVALFKEVVFMKNWLPLVPCKRVQVV